MAVDRCVIVNRQGVPYAELADFELGDLTWRAGPSHSASFAVGVFDRNVGEIRTKTREVQFWRDGTCIWWGRLDKARRQGARVEVGAVGLYDYFRYRYFGPPTANKLTNPGFENGLTGWAQDVSASSVSTPRARGALAARLTTPTAGQDAFLRQEYTEVHGGPTGGVVGFAVSGWVWIESFTGAANQERGLYVHSTQSGVGGTFDQRWQPINASTPQGKWVRLELDKGITAPTGVTFTVTVRLYCPAGVVYWDEIFLGPTTFIGSETFVDFNTIIERGVNHALAKDNALNITYNGVATGVTGTRLYALDTHASIHAALEEFVEGETCEFDIGWNAAATSRTFDLYAPRKGSSKPQYALEDGHGGRIVAIDGWEEGTTQTISKPRVLGQGDGTDREYAEATDTSLTDGVVFESVRSAPQETPLSGLDSLAAQDLARQRRPVKTPTVTCLADGLVGNLLWGDTVPVRIRDSGWPVVDETMRVSSLSLKGDNTLAVGLVTP